MNYGVAVSDVNQDGKDDFIVTGNGVPNHVYSYDENSDSYVNIIDGVTNMEVSPASLKFSISSLLPSFPFFVFLLLLRVHSLDNN